MRDRKKGLVSFPLRLVTSLKDRAKLLAARDGVSLNHFINLAVAEKISRLEVREDSFSVAPNFIEFPSRSQEEWS